MPVHYNKYIKIKLNIYNKKTDTNFYGNRISENDKYCACLSVISLDSIGKWKTLFTNTQKNVNMQWKRKI